MISTIFRNIVSILTGHVLSKAFSFFCIIFIARRLGVDKFGIYGTVMAYLTLFGALADYGMTTVTVRDVARKHALSDFYFSHTLVLRLFLTTVAYLLLLVLGRVWKPDFSLWFIATCGLFLFPEVFRKLAVALLSAHERMDIVATITVLATMFRHAPFLLAIFWGKSLHVAFSGFVIAWSCLAGITLLITRARCLQRWKLEVHWRPLRQILYEAFPFGVLFVLSIIYFKIDIVMLATMKGSTEVGFYEAAYKFIEASMFIPLSIVQVLLPAMSRMFTEDKPSYGQLYTHSARILAMGVLPAVILGTIFAEKIILLMYEETYLPSVPAFSILIWALFFIFVKAPVGNIIATSNMVHAFMPYAIANTSLNILLNFFLIPKYSFVGAGIATVVTECTGLAIQLHVANRVLKNSFSVLQSISKILIAGVVAGGALYLISPYLMLPLSVVIFLGIYVAVLFLIKGITQQDRQLLAMCVTMLKNKMSNVA